DTLAAAAYGAPVGARTDHPQTFTSRTRHSCAEQHTYSAPRTATNVAAPRFASRPSPWSALAGSTGATKPGPWPAPCSLHSTWLGTLDEAVRSLMAGPPHRKRATVSGSDQHPTVDLLGTSMSAL